MTRGERMVLFAIGNAVLAIAQRVIYDGRTRSEVSDYLRTALKEMVEEAQARHEEHEGEGS